MPLRNGKPRGECLACRNQRQQFKLLKRKVFKDFYQVNTHCGMHNTHALQRAHLDRAYALTHRTSQRPAGYIVPQAGAFYVEAWGHVDRFACDVYGVAMWLANQNLVVQGVVSVADADGKPIDLATLGVNMPKALVQDYLVMFDAKLKDWAIRKVKAELAEARSAHARLKDAPDA